MKGKSLTGGACVQEKLKVCAFAIDMFFHQPKQFRYNVHIGQRVLFKIKSSTRYLNFAVQTAYPDFIKTLFPFRSFWEKMGERSVNRSGLEPITMGPWSGLSGQKLSKMAGVHKTLYRCARLIDCAEQATKPARFIFSRQR